MAVPTTLTRDAVESAARQAGLDFSLNVVVNSHREIAGLYGGSPETALREAAKLARDTYQTPIPSRIVEETDVLLINSYPLDTDAHQEPKALWPRRLFPRTPVMLLHAASDGTSYHGWADLRKRRLLTMGLGSLGRLSVSGSLPSGVRWLCRRPALQAWARRHFQTVLATRLAATSVEFSRRKACFARDSLTKRLTASREGLCMCSRDFPEAIFAQRYPNGILARDWDALCESGMFKGPGGTITVLPCAPLQMPVDAVTSHV